MRALFLFALSPLLVSAVPGWSEGQVAAGTSETLTPAKPVQLSVPRTIADQVQAETAVFYFSPTCPHCQAVMPEIHRIIQPSGIPWIGVASGSATETQLTTFKEAFGLPFDVTIDTDRAFAQAMGARSTPTVYIMSPADQPDDSPGSRTMAVAEAYAPFVEGVGSLLVLRRHLEDPFVHFEGYQGPAVCIACHTQEGRSWSLSHHATAYSTLLKRDRAADQQCVGCHVTGLDQGGFEIGHHASPLRDVGCEACHGASGPHDGTPTDATASCTTCHNAEHSIAFKVERGLPHIDHYAANGLTEQQMQEQMSALMSGAAPRPLLAFPEGPTVGAQVCKSCHKGAHKAWSKGPHADAMATLKGPEAKDPNCVSCHATQQAYGGPPATTLEGYRTAESVGCESCHGSGQVHVEGPTKNNIVGLGEHCPECIIEGICTSCHTPGWDPQWDLKTRLKAIDH